MQWGCYNCRYLSARYCTSCPYYQHGALLSPSIQLTGPFCEANIRKKIYSCHGGQFHTNLTAACQWSTFQSN